MEAVLSTRKREQGTEEELHLLLCKFFKSLKKLDGTEYEPGSLTSFQRNLQCSLNERGSDVTIIEGDNFKLSNADNLS